MIELEIIEPDIYELDIIEAKLYDNLTDFIEKRPETKAAKCFSRQIGKINNEINESSSKYVHDIDGLFIVEEDETYTSIEKNGKTYWHFDSCMSHNVFIYGIESDDDKDSYRYVEFPLKEGNLENIREYLLKNRPN